VRFRLYGGLPPAPCPPPEVDGIVYEVATVVCAGSRGLTVTRFTGRLSFKNVVTKVLRVGSHQVMRYFGPGGMPPGMEKLPLASVVVW